MINKKQTNNGSIYNNIAEYNKVRVQLEEGIGGDIVAYFYKLSITGEKVVLDKHTISPSGVRNVYLSAHEQEVLQ